MSKLEIREIKINNKFYKVIINRKDNKNTYIRIDEKLNIVVNTNKFTKFEQIEALILKNQDKLAKIVKNKEGKNLPKNTLKYLGELYEITFQKRKGFNYDILDKKIIFYTELCYEESINLFYKNEADSYLPYRVKLCFENFRNFYNVPIPELSIRKMKSRYGTCYYTKNKICLNSYLVKYNDIQIDYVIYHELCHLIHHNHGSKFYESLNIIIPDHRSIHKSLNLN